ncbi:MAG: class I SAM-dependent methyltransferase [Vulcanibacillus sp.]
MDYVKYNSKAWDNEVKIGNEWTKPVSSETIEAAKNGEWEIVLTPTKVVPKDWFGDLLNKKVLCLASGGGQQGPVLAAAGANVTVFDNSIEQLKSEEYVAKRDGLKIRTIQGDMRDLSCFKNEEFDLIVHPVSNIFVDNIILVWNEASRVLKKGGRLLSGIANPLLFIFDYNQLRRGIFEVMHSIPYSDLTSITTEELNKYINSNEPISFGHSLEDQIKGQLDAGFVLTGFYEDDHGGISPLDKYIKTFIATCAVKA